MTFESLKLDPRILKAVTEAGYTSPTPIQASAIPEALAGHDVIASAQTGTGKTAAFVLPALHRIASNARLGRGPRVVVLTPTRELATQINDAAKKYGRFTNPQVVTILGGMPYGLQVKLLSRPVDVLVATPGRLLDHLNARRVDLSTVELLVLDEADRMLDMGFIDDVEKIAAATAKSRQTMLFSATLDGSIGKLAQKLLKEPKIIEMAQQTVRNENIEQRLHFVDDIAHKQRLLNHLLSGEDLTQAIVFTATKRDADSLAQNLYADGHSAAALHGDMSQQARNRTITKLRRGAIRVLVATDVAARGIDVNGISHVINFDLPKFAEDYVHRIGRTGRAGASGIAISFASTRDGINLKKIERYTGQRLTAQTVAGFEPRRNSAAAPTVVHKRRPGQGFGGKPNASAPKSNSSWRGQADRGAKPAPGARRERNGNRFDR